MPFPFISVCELLEKLYQHATSASPKSNAAIVIDWYNQHRNCIDDPKTDPSALLSTLLPEKRTDRVYFIKSPTLQKIIGRALMLGSSRIDELSRYQKPGYGDLGDCVERILSVTVSYVPAHYCETSHMPMFLSLIIFGSPIPILAKSLISLLRRSIRHYTGLLPIVNSARPQFAHLRVPLQVCSGRI
jgi:hypothetical protein